MAEMNSVRSTKTSPSPTQSEDVVSLRNWPLRDDGPAAWLVLIAAVAISVGVGILSSSVIAGGVSMFALAVSLWRLWLPVRFEIGPRGIAQQVFGSRRLIIWRNIPRVEIREQGIIFHASSNPSRFALLRSIYVRDRDHRRAILDILERFAVQGYRRGSSIGSHRSARVQSEQSTDEYS